MPALIAPTKSEAWRFEQEENLKEVTMTTLVAPSENKSKTAYAEPLDPEISTAIEAVEGIVVTGTTVSYPPAVVRQDGLLARVARRLMAFNDWLSGPPMTQFERTNRDIKEWELTRKYEWYSY